MRNVCRMGYDLFIYLLWYFVTIVNVAITINQIATIFPPIHPTTRSPSYGCPCSLTSCSLTTFSPAAAISYKIKLWDFQNRRGFAEIYKFAPEKKRDGYIPHVIIVQFRRHSDMSASRRARINIPFNIPDTNKHPICLGDICQQYEALTLAQENGRTTGLHWEKIIQNGKR